MDEQVVLPLGDTPGRRAGPEPWRYPLCEGDRAVGVTGEAVVVRRKPDLDKVSCSLRCVGCQTHCRVPLTSISVVWYGADTVSRPAHPYLMTLACPHRSCCDTALPLPRPPQVREALAGVLRRGIRSLAIVFKHAFLFPDHERAVGAVAREMGFTQVSLSSEVMPMVKMVPRGFTAAADAYLTPHIMKVTGGHVCV